mmetsp:Transcript_16952/g.53163  ORF Transcript_16952/g.53163 Transcript_16952/m.53163 type:complete len:903 (-) Transcript_16952:247-2955(-)
MMKTFAVPKVLLIESRRLAILNFVVMTLFLGGLAIKVFLDELFYSSLPVLTNSQVTVDPHSLKGMADFEVADDPLCQASTRATTWHGLSVRCSRACPFDVISPKCCVSLYEVIEQSTFDQVFLLTDKAIRCISHVGTIKCGPPEEIPFMNDPFVCPTPTGNASFSESLQTVRNSMLVDGGGPPPALPKETLLRSACAVDGCMDGNSSCPKEAPPRCRHSSWLLEGTPIAAGSVLEESGFTHSIFPSVGRLSLQISYSYEITGNPPFVPWSRSHALSGSNGNALTVVLDRLQGIHRAFLPGESIVLSLPSLLAVSHGLPESVSAALPRIEQWVWLKGGEITAYVDCFTSLRDLSSKVQTAAWGEEALGGRLKQLGVARPLCVLNVSWTDARSVGSLPITTLEEHRGGQVGVLRRLTGLRVRVFRGGGSARFFDLNVLVQQATSAVVLYRIPNFLLRIFVLFCLGELSRIYRRVSWDTYSIADECGGTVCRLAMQNLAFQELSNGEASISPEMLTARLQEVMRHQGLKLDTAEVSHLSDFCFRQVATNRSRASLDIDAFCSACSSGDRITFEQISQLFDADRKKHNFEKALVPPELRHQRTWVRNAREEELAAEPDLDGVVVDERPTLDGAPPPAETPGEDPRGAQRGPQPESPGGARWTSSSSCSRRETLTARERLEEEVRQLRATCAEQEAQLVQLREGVAELRRQLGAQAETCRAELAGLGRLQGDCNAKVDGLRTSLDREAAQGKALEAHGETLEVRLRKLERQRCLEERLAAVDARVRELEAWVEEQRSERRAGQTEGLLAQLREDVQAMRAALPQERRGSATGRSQFEGLERELTAAEERFARLEEDFGAKQALPASGPADWDVPPPLQTPGKSSPRQGGRNFVLRPADTPCSAGAWW